MLARGPVGTCDASSFRAHRVHATGRTVCNVPAVRAHRSARGTFDRGRAARIRRDARLARGAGDASALRVADLAVTTGAPGGPTLASQTSRRLARARHRSLPTPILRLARAPVETCDARSFQAHRVRVTGRTISRISGGNACGDLSLASDPPRSTCRARLARRPLRGTRLAVGFPAVSTARKKQRQHHETEQAYMHHRCFIRRERRPS